MQRSVKTLTTASIKYSIARGLTALFLATTLTVSLNFVVETPSASAAAAPLVAASRDRRPDRERPVNTSGGADSSTQGSSSSSTDQARPRIVRR